MKTHTLISMKNMGAIDIDNMEYLIFLKREKDNSIIVEGNATLILSANSFHLSTEFEDKLASLGIDDSTIREALENRDSSIFLEIIPQLSNNEKIHLLVERDILIIKEELANGDSSFLRTILNGAGFIPYVKMSEQRLNMEFNSSFPEKIIKKEDLAAIKTILTNNSCEELCIFSDNTLLGAIRVLSGGDINISNLIIHYLENIRFDKKVITKKELTSRLSLKDTDELEVFEGWLDDSKWTYCDECLAICDPEDEVRYKGYDFDFTGEDDEKIECLCDLCFAEKEQANILRKVA